MSRFLASAIELSPLGILCIYIIELAFNLIIYFILEILFSRKLFWHIYYCCDIAIPS